MQGTDGPFLKKCGDPDAVWEKDWYEGFGEMLFTHFGISGPLVLTLSSLLPEEGEVRLSLDLKPALEGEKLEAASCGIWSSIRTGAWKTLWWTCCPGA